MEKLEKPCFKNRNSHRGRQALTPNPSWCPAAAAGMAVGGLSPLMLMFSIKHPLDFLGWTPFLFPEVIGRNQKWQYKAGIPPSWQHSRNKAAVRDRFSV